MQNNTQPDNLAILQGCKKRGESRRLGRLLEGYNECLTANAEIDKSGLVVIHTAELELAHGVAKPSVTVWADYSCFVYLFGHFNHAQNTGANP